MGKKDDLSDFERGMVVGVRRADLSISKTADLLGFSHTTNVPSNCISCGAKLFSIGRRFRSPEQKHYTRPVERTHKKV